jgi:cytochrome oxidase Cu insertion factor (SCO1/SenC/PrrC family)
VSGMGGRLSTANSTIVSAFHSALLHQFLIVLVIVALLSVAWNVLRGVQLRQAIAGRQPGVVNAGQLKRSPEPLARRILRIGFGLIWLFDGLLQAQSAMPVGLANQAIGPAASGSPNWVVSLVNSGVVIWNNHPITAAASAVWIQVGIGVWLLVAPRGRWSELGAIASVGWGLVVWSFGEAFGGIFAPGLTFLFGAPGAVLFYCLAGGLVALPERVWSSPKVGKLTLGAMGLFFVDMAVLQAWPGRGFWQGQVRGRPAGGVVGMAHSMAVTPQPRLLAGWVRAFGSFDAAHGFAVNLFVVIALSAIGLAFCSGRPGLARAGVVAGLVLCLADWVLIEDFGFFGGLGTDPNSMIPITLVFIAAYAALVSPAPSTAAAPASDLALPLLARAKLDPGYAFRSLAAAGAGLITLLGAAPMALASTNPHADPIITEATNGTPATTNTPSPGFSLTDQNGRTVSLASLSGKTIALTFLDPVCTSDCPIIGQEFRQADLELGDRGNRTEFIAVVANPTYRSTFYMNAFDREEYLDQLPNWLFLTGSVAQLTKVWYDYGIQVSVAPAGAMVDHTDVAYVIGPDGHTRYIISAGPGAGTLTTESSFAGLLDQELRRVMSG